jgi:hypothetical protein
MTTYHIPPADYTAIIDAIRKSEDWRDDGTRETLTLELRVPNVNISITRYVSGVWGCGGTYGDERERLYEVTGEDYEVTSFECFDAEDNDIPSDFDKSRIEGALSWPRCKTKAA